MVERTAHNVETSFQADREALDGQPPGRNVLIVFAKSPQPGTVKTRLTPAVSAEQSAALYEAFMQDIFARCEAVAADVRVYASPPVDAFPAELLPAGSTLHEQRGRGLGARMHHAFEDCFEVGYTRAVITGTDHPTICPSIFRQALAALRPGTARNVPIGPSTDGGYYLLGLSAPCPSLFDMRYSHSNVLAQTMRAAAAAGRLPVILPTWYDVDRPRDLHRLIRELRRFPDRAPRTWDVLNRLEIAPLPGK